MKDRLLALLLLCIVAIEGNAQDQDSTSQQHYYSSELVHQELITAKFMNEFYHHYSLEHFIENYYDLAYYESETIGDFSRVDPYTFSFTGQSYQWNRYYLGDHRINDLYYPGSSIYKPYLYDKDVTLNMVKATVGFQRNEEYNDRVIFQWNNGYLGGRLPDADGIINFILDHPSSFQMAYVPIEERKRTTQNGHLFLTKTIDSKNGPLHQELSMNIGAREHTGFNYAGIDKTWVEDHIQLSLSGELPNISNRLFDKTNYLVGIDHRDNLFSEFYYDLSETAKYNRFVTSIYGSKTNEGSTYSLGLNYGHRKIEHNNLNFSRNLIDQDGEGYEPWYPDAKVNDLALAFKLSKPFKSNPHLSFNADTYNGLILHNPIQNQFSNTTYFQDTTNNFTPLQVIDWQSNDFTTGLLENTAGLTYKKNLGRKWSFSSTLDFTLDGILLNDKSIVRPNYQIDAQLTFLSGRKSRVKFQTGRSRIPFHFDQVRFLSNDYLSGQSFYWNDINGNQALDVGERNGQFSTTGGRYHHIGDNLKQPAMYYIDLEWDWKIGKNWSLYFIGQYRLFSSLWTVEYVQPVQNIGSFTTIDNRDIFFLNGGQQVDYRIVQFKKDLMEQGAQQDLSPLFQQPFYGGTSIKIVRETDRVFYAGSFTAYMVTGYGGQGNGVLHNTPGALTETLANPNNYFNFLGRYDSDRAFIIRTLMGFKFGRRWSLAFSILWKDGQPFNLNQAALSQSGNQNQLAIWDQNIKGINPFTGQFGTRESAYFNIEYRLKYETQLNDHPLVFNLNIYNALDLGTTLGGFIFSPTDIPGERFVLDVQIPRGMIFSVNYEF